MPIELLTVVPFASFSELTILPSVLLSLVQSGLVGGGSICLFTEPVTFPQTMNWKLWASFWVSNLAWASTGTHCKNGGCCDCTESGRQLVYLIWTAEAGRQARDRRSMMARSPEGVVMRLVRNRGMGRMYFLRPGRLVQPGVCQKQAEAELQQESAEANGHVDDESIRA